MEHVLSLAQAAACLREGGIVAYPTEAVWGIGCDPFSQASVSRLLAIKQRSADKGLILLAERIDMIVPLLNVDSVAPAMWGEIERSWPGPMTWVIPASERVPLWIRGLHTTVAVRVTDHPVAAALSREFDGPLVSTSANRAMQPPVRHRDDLDVLLVQNIDGIVVGETGTLTQPTRIRDAVDGRFLRD